MANLEALAIRGKQIEVLIQRSDYPEGIVNVSNHGTFDIITPKKLVEVKACKRLTIANKEKGDRAANFRTGRFVIQRNSHDYIKHEANERDLSSEYAFVIYDLGDVEADITSIKILHKIALPWERVNELVLKSKIYTRYDGNPLVYLKCTEIFEGLK